MIFETKTGMTIEVVQSESAKGKVGTVLLAIEGDVYPFTPGDAAALAELLNVAATRIARSPEQNGTTGA
jgi:hypothetical protein